MLEVIAPLAPATGRAACPHAAGDDGWRRRGDTPPYQNGDDDWTPLGDFYSRHGLSCELHIDLTDGCNEKCVHCYLPHGGAHYIDKETELEKFLLLVFDESNMI